MVLGRTLTLEFPGKKSIREEEARQRQAAA
jgi:hypothetical protein